MRYDNFKVDKDSGAVVVNRSPEYLKIVELEKEITLLEDELKEIHSSIDKILSILEKR